MSMKALARLMVPRHVCAISSCVLSRKKSVSHRDRVLWITQYYYNTVQQYYIHSIILYSNIIYTVLHCTAILYTQYYTVQQYYIHSITLYSNIIYTVLHCTAILYTQYYTVQQYYIHSIILYSNIIYTVLHCTAILRPAYTMRFCRMRLVASDKSRSVDWENRRDISRANREAAYSRDQVAQKIKAMPPFPSNTHQVPRPRMA